MEKRWVVLIAVLAVCFVAAAVVAVGLTQVGYCEDTGDAATSTCDTYWEWSFP